MKKGYFGETGEQVHFRRFGRDGEQSDIPLICFPPAPHTGAVYEKILPFLSEARLAEVRDYPGYGGSDRLNADVSIANFAKRVTSDFDETTQVDLFGFHSGALVAVEVALLHPKAVRNIIMVDVPYFSPDTRMKYAASLSSPSLPVTVELSFEKAVTNRHETVEEDRAFYLWVETLRSGRFQSDTFRAAFEYKCEDRFPLLEHKVDIVATTSSLLEPSRVAASVLPNASYSERLDITAPVFEAHSKTLSETLLNL